MARETVAHGGDSTSQTVTPPTTLYVTSTALTNAISISRDSRWAECILSTSFPSRGGEGRSTTHTRICTTCSRLTAAPTPQRRTGLREKYSLRHSTTASSVQAYQGRKPAQRSASSNRTTRSKVTSHECISTSPLPIRTTSGKARPQTRR